MTCGGVSREPRHPACRITTHADLRHSFFPPANSQKRAGGFHTRPPLPFSPGYVPLFPKHIPSHTAAALVSLWEAERVNVGNCLSHHPRPFQMAPHLGIPEQPHLLGDTSFSPVESVSGEQPAGQSTTPAFLKVASRTPDAAAKTETVCSAWPTPGFLKGHPPTGMAAGQGHVTLTDPLLSFPFGFLGCFHLLPLDLGETVTWESSITAATGFETGCPCTKSLPAAF